MLKITFEFVGGPHDGQMVVGKEGESGDAERYYLATNHGTVGQWFKVASEYMVELLARELKAHEQRKNDRRHHFQRHFYVVTDRIEAQNEVFTRAHYVAHTAEADC